MSWISVKEKLPTNNDMWVPVYGTDDGVKKVNIGYYDAGGKRWLTRLKDDDGMWVLWEEVTHWQPLPAPPTED